MKREETYSYVSEDEDVGDIKSTLDHQENDQQQVLLEFQEASNELQIPKKARVAFKLEQIFDDSPFYEDIQIIQSRKPCKKIEDSQGNKLFQPNHPYKLTESLIRKMCKDEQQSSNPRKKRVHIDLKLLQIIIFLFEQRAKNHLISLQSIASRMKLSYATICKLYREWSLDSSEFKNKFFQKNIKGKKKVLTSFRIEALEKLLHLNPFLIQNQIVEELNKIQILKSPKGSITRFVVYELIKVAGFKKKKSKRLSPLRNQPEYKKFRKYYCKRYYQLLRTPKTNIYFIGELDINIFTVRGQGWCKQDQELVLRCPKAKSESTTAFFIFHKNGTFMSHIKVGSFSEGQIYQLVQKFMNQINQKFPHRKNYVIIDLSNFQTTLKHQVFKQKLKIEQILWIPPFSSQLSIVQHFFYSFKQKLRVKKVESQVQIKIELQKMVKQDHSKNFTTFLDRTSYYASMGIQSGDF